MNTFELLLIFVVTIVAAIVVAYYATAALQLYHSEKNIKKTKERAENFVWELHRKGELTRGQVTVYLILLEMITDEENAETNASILRDIYVKYEQEFNDGKSDRLAKDFIGKRKED